jgi:acetyl esterase/lipase
MLVWGSARAQDIQRDIPYGPDPQQVMDLYPAAQAPAPLVVFVHGGGWTGGTKNAGRRVASVLSRDGYTVATIGYRLLREGTTIQDQAADVAHAIAFILAHAGTFGVKPQHFALVGHSAGGHLVALVGADPSYLRAAGVDPDRLSVVVTMDGVFDLDRPEERRHLPGTAATSEQDWRALSPIDQLDTAAKRPAFCIVHEDRVPRFVFQAQAFVAALRAHHIGEDEKVAPGLTHGALVFRFDDPSTPTAGLVVQCLRQFFM